MDLSFIGVTTAKKNQFAKRGIESVQDLLAYIPRKYNDFSKVTGILPPESISVLRVTVTDVSIKNAGQVPYVAVKCVEEMSNLTVRVMWFHAQWMYDNLRSYYGKQAIVIGKVEHNQYGYSIIQPINFGTEECLRVQPTYKSVPGMSQNYLEDKITAALDAMQKNSETLPEDILVREGETPMPQALQYLHHPQTLEETKLGTQRIILNDLLYFAVHNHLNNAEVSLGSQYNIKTLFLVRKILENLPYELTDDQKKAVRAMTDMAKEGKRLNSLVVGDVGSGKTIVCALMAAAFIGSGYQVVLMAPTQVLAKQHLDTMADLFRPYGVKIAYLDSSLKAREKKIELAAIASGEAQLVIGTHACIGKDVQYCNLALTVVDEEHKFGVKQRAAIVEKASAGVHSITMSATPIPRSLAQVIYGTTIQLHTIKTMPIGRKPITTFIEQEDKKIFEFLRSEIKSGHQAYVVCPMIDSNENLPGTRSVEEIADLYEKKLKPYKIRIATLTGRDDAHKTDDVLERFRAGLVDILIATTVIEVGVNVPNATVMVVTSAERFGLSGLHQLRGRVGRGSAQSFCILQSGVDDGKAFTRLKVLCDSNDGFHIAEEDLKLRGTGDFLGTQQSGFNKYITLMLENPDKYEKAVRLAKELIDRGMDCCKFTADIQKEREGV